jgi:hypothetical protein
VLLGDERPRRLICLKCVYVALSSCSVRPKDLLLRYHSSQPSALHNFSVPVDAKEVERRVLLASMCEVAPLVAHSLGCSFFSLLPDCLLAGAGSVGSEAG